LLASCHAANRACRSGCRSVLVVVVVLVLILFLLLLFRGIRDGDTFWRGPLSFTLTWTCRAPGTHRFLHRALRRTKFILRFGLLLRDLLVEMTGFRLLTQALLLPWPCRNRRPIPHPVRGRIEARVMVDGGLRQGKAGLQTVEHAGEIVTVSDDGSVAGGSRVGGRG
jgi:hypothetical protein